MITFVYTASSITQRYFLRILLASMSLLPGKETENENKRWKRRPSVESHGCFRIGNLCRYGANAPAHPNWYLWRDGGVYAVHSVGWNVLRLPADGQDHLPDRKITMTDNTHAEVLAAATAGDDQALALLVRTYHERVFRFGMRVCRDGFDADDAVQEAFTKLAKRPDVMKHEGALSWLMTVVKNSCIRMFRLVVSERRTLGQRIDPETVQDEQLDPQQAMERWESVQAVHAAIAKLAPPYRQVLILRDLEGMSGEDTCQLLGIETAAMKTRLHRARQQLRESLLKHAPDGRPLKIVN
jgi:RNA polymerase sigma-70 factor, ECF subfamily